MPKHQLLILYASVTSDARARADTDSLRSLLEAKGAPYVLVDGASAETRELRSALFAASGLRGVYPQLFLRELPPGVSSKLVSVPAVDERFAFLGDWPALERANEDDTPGGGLAALLAPLDRVAVGRALLGSIVAGCIISPPMRDDDEVAAENAALAAARVVRVADADEPAAAAVLLTAPPPAAAAPSAAAAAARAPSPPRAAAAAPARGASARAAGGAAPAAAAPAAPAPAAQAAAAAPAAAELWSRRVSSSGEEFFVHAHTQEVAWTDPTTAVALASGGDAVWVPMVDDSNRNYYYNYRSGETRWEL